MQEPENNISHPKGLLPMKIFTSNNRFCVCERARVFVCLFVCVCVFVMSVFIFKKLKKLVVFLCYLTFQVSKYQITENTSVLQFSEQMFLRYFEEYLEFFAVILNLYLFASTISR